MDTRGGRGGRRKREMTDMSTGLGIKQITDENTLNSTGNAIQCSAA